jgi:hypothetical protein
MANFRLFAANGKEKTETANFRMSAANGNGKRTFVYLSWQSIKSNQRLLFQQTCPSMIIYLLACLVSN